MAASVLYVDDDRNLSQIVARALRGEGYEVRTAFDGDEAVAQIRQQPPDLLLLDLLLPRRDGFEVLEEIRGLSGSAAALPVVLVTGCTPTPSYAARARALGALDLLSKPVPLEKLLEVVLRQLGGHGPRPPAKRSARRGISGTLGRIPFPAVLHHLHGLRASGVLHLVNGKRRKWIQLRDGYPIAVRSNLVGETLGHQLVRSGCISRSDLEASRRKMEVEDRRQGEILVAMELLSEQELVAALRQQADAKFFELFSWSEGEFRFARDAGLERSSALGSGRSPANLILQGVRSHFPIERVDRYLKTHGQRYVAHAESPFYRFQDVRMDPAEQALLRGLDGSQRLGDFVREGEGLRRTLYGLLAIGLLELRREGSAGRSRGSAGSGSAGRRGRVVETRRDGAREDPRLAELQQLAKKLRAGSAFEVLGVDPDATPGSLREAYERMSARTHPDRFAGASAAVKDLAAEVSGLVNAAYETLSDPRRLTEHLLDQQRRRRDEAHRAQGERALEAETQFRRGETALSTRDYESALKHFGRALELYPDEGDHHAHYGWALYLCHPGDPSIVSEALEHVRRGLKLASHHEKPYLFMGRLYKAVGRADVAEKMFTRAVQIHPECVEALRELRLIHMRREKSKGLIGRLLRR